MGRVRDALVNGPGGVVAPAQEPLDPPPAFTLALGAAAFALYLALAPRTLGDGDAAEFTLVLAVGGVAHPPGYPLYTLLGHAWATAVHALGAGWARAASSFSALGGAVAIAAMHALATRLTPGGAWLGRRGRAWVALAPCAAFAVLPAWTRETTVAEVNSWHLALVALLALAAHRIAVSEPGRLRERALATALGWGALCGVALGHHPTALFAVAPLTVVVGVAAWRAGVRDLETWLAGVAGVALALTPALWIAWRAAHPASYQWPLLEPTAASVIGHLRGGIYAGYLGHFAPSPDQRRVLVDQVLPGLLAGLAALIIAAWRHERAGDRLLLGGMLGACALGLAFALGYGVIDPVVYFLPPLMLALAALAVAGGRLADRLRTPVAAAPVVIALGALAALGVGDARARARALEANDAALHARWRALPFERGFVILGTDYHVRLMLWQQLAGEHPGLAVVDPAMLTWPPPRRAFERRFGFDPLAGLELRDDGDLPLIAPNIARQTPLPVIDFERWRP